MENKKEYCKNFMDTRIVRLEKIIKESKIIPKIIVFVENDEYLKRVKEIKEYLNGYVSVLIYVMDLELEEKKALKIINDVNMNIHITGIGILSHRDRRHRNLIEAISKKKDVFGLKYNSLGYALEQENREIPYPDYLLAKTVFEYWKLYWEPSKAIVMEPSEYLQDSFLFARYLLDDPLIKNVPIIIADAYESKIFDNEGVRENVLYTEPDVDFFQDPELQIYIATGIIVDNIILLYNNYQAKYLWKYGKNLQNKKEGK